MGENFLVEERVIGNLRGPSGKRNAYLQMIHLPKGPDATLEIGHEKIISELT